MAIQSYLTIDRERSAERIEHDIETLAGSDYTLSSDAICRYAYTDVYRNTLNYFRCELERLKFDVFEDPVGTLVARNRTRGEKVFGIGSHCDSNRNGGKYDGTMGVVTALEVCRLNHELELGLPLQLISFLEEEGSGFGQTLLGSRITAQRVTDEDLKDKLRSLDNGVSFWEAAVAAGYEPERWRESEHILDDLVGWIEMHIEQARVLQDTGDRIGIVTAIAGYVHGDITVFGRADHAGATPMDMRLDPGTVVAESILELERLAQDAGKGTVGTVGESEFSPGILNVIPAKARFSVDIRGVDEEAYRGIVASIVEFAEEAARRRGMRTEFAQRATAHATPMDDTIVGLLEAAAKASGEPYRLMPTGAGHDTMFVAAYAPVGMVFVPCEDGISHSPLEEAKPADAAVAAEIMLNAIHDYIAAA
jgi:allantoate deiminase